LLKKQPVGQDQLQGITACHFLPVLSKVCNIVIANKNRENYTAISKTGEEPGHVLIRRIMDKEQGECFEFQKECLLQYHAFVLHPL